MEPQLLILPLLLMLPQLRLPSRRHAKQGGHLDSRLGWRVVESAFDQTACADEIGVGLGAAMQDNDPGRILGIRKVYSLTVPDHSSSQKSSCVRFS